MKLKLFICTAILLVLTGCFAEAGQVVYEFFGGSTLEGDSPASALFGTAGPYLPGGLGLALVGLGKLLHGAIKTRKALFESNEEAINNGSLAQATTPEAVKEALNGAQKAHHDSKLLEKSFDKHKNGGVVKKILKKVGQILPASK